MDVDEQPTLRRAGLTEHIRASLAPGHAWRAFVSQAARRLHLAPCPPAPELDDTTTCAPATEAASNAECTLRARRARHAMLMRSAAWPLFALAGRLRHSSLPGALLASPCGRTHYVPTSTCSRWCFKQVLTSAVRAMAQPDGPVTAFLNRDTQAIALTKLEELSNSDLDASRAELHIKKGGKLRQA